MEKIEENISLTEKEVKKIKNILNKNKFENFKIHKHYWLNGIEGIPRHGIELEKIKGIFNKTKLISGGFKRKTKLGFSYTLFYKLSGKSFMKICYFFDETPMKIFNAILNHRNIEKSVLRKYGLRI
tara:strand:- start:1453 stop:1830 length:378 start_codon:yes stop_codon:yes gene_type:complete